MRLRGQLQEARAYEVYANYNHSLLLKLSELHWTKSSKICKVYQKPCYTEYWLKTYAKIYRGLKFKLQLGSFLLRGHKGHTTRTTQLFSSCLCVGGDGCTLSLCREYLEILPGVTPQKGPGTRQTGVKTLPSCIIRNAGSNYCIKY